MRIGFVGYSGQKFDQDKARLLLGRAIDDLTPAYFGCAPYQIDWQAITIVSGLTRIGIPAIAYDFAYINGCKTMGVACQKALDYECYPCDRVHLIGDNWGDESEAFLASIDLLIRIGGGNQSKAEVGTAKTRGIPVLEYELEAIA